MGKTEWLKKWLIFFFQEWFSLYGVKFINECFCFVVNIPVYLSAFFQTDVKMLTITLLRN